MIRRDTTYGLAIIFISIAVSSCQSNQTKEIDTDSIASREAPKELRPEFMDTVQFLKLSMYNSPYCLEISPKWDSLKGQVIIDNVLIAHGDTVVSTKIDRSLLYSLLDKNHRWDSLKNTFDLQSYHLYSIRYLFVRTSSNYLEAELRSAESERRMYIKYGWRYIEGSFPIGNIWGFGFSSSPDYRRTKNRYTNLGSGPCR